MTQVSAPLGRSANYRHPSNRRMRWLAEALANSRSIRALRRSLFALLPFPVLESDVRDVLYLSWVVPMHSAEAALPPGVTPWHRQESTVLTTLVYRHGHFGPALLGPLRRLFPSPLQSNWRLYVAGVAGTSPSHPTVLFLRNFFDSALHAIGTRLGSDALPSELPSSFQYRTGREMWASIVGASGELELEVTATLGGSPALPAPFEAFASTWHEAVVALTLQESALVQPPDLPRLAQARISLPVDVSEIRPVTVTHWTPGSWLAELGAGDKPFAFFVPRVRFRVLGEELVACDGNSSPPTPGRAPG